MSDELSYVAPSQKRGETLRPALEFAPLQDESYIAKIVGMSLRHKPGFKQTKAGKWFMDFSQPKPIFDVVLAIYKRKAEDGILDVNGQVVKPLLRRVNIEISALSPDFKKDKAPTLSRSLLCYATNQEVSGAIKTPVPVFYNTIKRCFASADSAKKYDTDLRKLFKGESPKLKTYADIAGYKEGIRHIWDLRKLVGRYVGVHLIVNGDFNKAYDFSRVPETFKADLEIEQKGLEKLEESEKKRIERVRAREEREGFTIDIQNEELIGQQELSQESSKVVDAGNDGVVDNLTDTVENETIEVENIDF